MKNHQKTERDARELPQSYAVPRAFHIVLIVAIFVIGVAFGPVVYPYKLYYSDSLSRIISVRLYSVFDLDTYTDPNFIHGLIGFSIVLLISRLFLKISDLVTLYVSALFLGMYYDIMTSGGIAGKIHIKFDDLFTNISSGWLRAPLSIIVPITVMCGLPILFVYLLSKVRSSLTSALMR